MSDHSQHRTTSVNKLASHNDTTKNSEKQHKGPQESTSPLGSGRQSNYNQQALEKTRSTWYPYAELSYSATARAAIDVRSTNEDYSAMQRWKEETPQEQPWNTFVYTAKKENK